jgi:hypothetical protein
MGNLGGLFNMGGGSGGMGMGGILPMLMNGQGMGFLQMMQGKGQQDQPPPETGLAQSHFLQPMQPQRRPPTMANFLQGTY